MTTKRIVGLAEEAIIGAFFEVYNTLGYGFLESVYVAALVRELKRLGHHVELEVMVRIWYKGDIIARQRVDMIVDGKVVVELKAGLALHSTAPRQLYNYLRATDKEVGLLLHFGRNPSTSANTARTRRRIIRRIRQCPSNPLTLDIIREASRRVADTVTTVT